MRRLLPLLVPLVLLLGCGTRPHSNPFDPGNPSTSGRPAGFEALAGDTQVRLRWLAVPAGNNLIGFQVFRKGPNAGTYTAISSTLPINATSFLDVGLLNDQDYSYRLYYVFLAGLGSLPAEDVATPGTPVPWVVESDATEALRITADGRRVAARYTGFAGTFDVAVNTQNGHVWVSDPGNARVVVINPQSGVRTAIPFSEPGAIAVDSYNGTAWVCGFNSVAHFREQGDEATLPIADLAAPIDAAVDPRDGSVWICDRGANRVRKFDTSANESFAFRSVPAPTRVAVDSLTGTAWITSFTRGTVTRIDASGTILDTLDLFVTPVGISIDHVAGRIWVADPGAGQIVALRRDGSVELRLGGFVDAGELSADPRTGEVWAVLGDPGELVKVAPTGVVRRRTGGFSLPMAVAVDPGGHFGAPVASRPR